MRLPEWMKDEFEKGECPYCESSLSEKGVQSHGIKEERSKTKKKIRYVHFYDYKCQKCKDTAVFSFPTTFKEFITDMIELSNMDMPPQLHDGETTETDVDSDDIPVPNKKSGISDDEVSEVKKTLEESDGLKDFFGKIGIDIRTNKEKPDESK